MTVRVWVPASLGLLDDWFGAREVAPGRGHAVTAELRDNWPEGSDEEWEYAVLLAAADDAAVLLDRPGRRVVVVLEAPSVEELDGTRVAFAGPVPWRRVAAVHADPADVAVALGADVDELPDLGWYGAQEVPDLLRGGQGWSPDRPGPT